MVMQARGNRATRHKRLGDCRAVAAKPFARGLVARPSGKLRPMGEKNARLYPRVGRGSGRAIARESNRQNQQRIGHTLSTAGRERTPVELALEGVLRLLVRFV